jgi:hypothetical protein
MHLHSKTPRDLIAQVHQPPAYHFMLFQPRTFADPLANRRLLLRRQLARRGTGFWMVLQAVQPVIVVAMHPVAQCLPIHPGGSRRLDSSVTLQHQSERKHPPRRCRVLAARCGRS